jgi:hypothetical protein
VTEHGYTVIEPDVSPAVVERCIRGAWQRKLIHGDEPWSGANISGRASTWGRYYQRSGDNLRERLRRAGLIVERFRGEHNRRCYRISLPS